MSQTEGSTNFPAIRDPKVSPHWTASTISHLSVPVSNLERSVAFYDEVLATLGYKRVMTFCETVGYGIPYRSYGFWIGKAHDGFKQLPSNNNRMPGMHICFQAPSRKAVDDFYKTALRLGASDEGKPGIRHYTPDYYAAFVIDPDGWKIEAVYLDAWYFIIFRAIWPTIYLLTGAALAWGYFTYLK